MALLILHSLALLLSSLHETGHVSPFAPEECRWESRARARCSMWQGLATSCRVFAEDAMLWDEGRCNKDCRWSGGRCLESHLLSWRCCRPTPLCHVPIRLLAGDCLLELLAASAALRHAQRGAMPTPGRHLLFRQFCCQPMHRLYVSGGRHHRFGISEAPAILTCCIPALVGVFHTKESHTSALSCWPLQPCEVAPGLSGPVGAYSM